MLEAGPGPLGLYLVQGVAEINQETKVVALAERVVEVGSPERGNDKLYTDEVEAVLHTRRRLFARGKGDLGRTDIVQHQINTGDHPSVTSWPLALYRRAVMRGAARGVGQEEGWQH